LFRDGFGTECFPVIGLSNEKMIATVEDPSIEGAMLRACKCVEAVSFEKILDQYLIGRRE